MTLSGYTEAFQALLFLSLPCWLVSVTAFKWSLLLMSNVLSQPTQLSEFGFCLEVKYLLMLLNSVRLLPYIAGYESNIMHRRLSWAKSWLHQKSSVRWSCLINSTSMWCSLLIVCSHTQIFHSLLRNMVFLTTQSLNGKVSLDRITDFLYDVSTRLHARVYHKHWCHHS